MTAYTLTAEPGSFSLSGKAAALRYAPVDPSFLPGYQPAPIGYPAPVTLQQAAAIAWVVQIVQTVNRSLEGKLNATAEITLTAGTTTTDLIDSRVSAYSVILFMPLTANAAAELASGTMYVSAQMTGEATITHANDVSTDRRFRALIIA